MFKAIALQLGVVLVVALIAGAVLGPRGASSALIGGSAYLVPNLLFALRLKVAGGVASFLAGELLKLAATVAILVLAQKFWDVHWLAMLAGLFAALKANLFAFLLKT